MSQHFQQDDTVYFTLPQVGDHPPLPVPGVVKEVFGSCVRVELARKKKGNWTYEFRAVDSMSLSHRPKGSAPMDNQRLPLSFSQL